MSIRSSSRTTTRPLSRADEPYRKLRQPRNSKKDAAADELNVEALFGLNEPEVLIHFEVQASPEQTIGEATLPESFGSLLMSSEGEVVGAERERGLDYQVA